MKTEELIASLASDAEARRLLSPVLLVVAVALGLMFYLCAMQCISGIRPDMVRQLGRPLFVLELALLLLLGLASVCSAVAAMYPDVLQKPFLLRLPYVFLASLAALMGGQSMLPADPLMNLPPPGGHGIECTLSIAVLSMLPSALMFMIIRRGANVHPLRAGSFCVLASAALSCLILRIAEPNDSIVHLVSWHYLPTMLFAAIGTWLGSRFLRW